jgi:hypothetical protein
MTVRWLTPEAFAAHQARRRTLPVAGVANVCDPLRAEIEAIRSELDAGMAEFNGNAGGSASGNAPALAPPCSASPPAKPPSDLYRIVALCRAEGLPLPIPEYAFAAPARKWRADYCWPIRKVIVEIDGGLWTQGRHSRGAGMLADFAKLNAATLLGYAVLRYGPHQIADCMRDLRRIFA